MRRLIICTITMICCSISNAQTGLNIFQSNNQEIVAEAVGSTLALVETEYLVEDSTGNRYGRLGNAYFGRSLSVGCNLRFGFTVTPEVFLPQEYDSNYDRYRDAYKAVVSKCVIHSKQDSILDKQSINLAEEYADIAQKQLRMYDGVSVAYNTSIQLCADTGQVAGWLVWVSHIGDSISYSDPQTKITVIRQTLDIKLGQHNYPVNKPNDTAIPLGGIFVIPQYLEPGYVVFPVSGIISRTTKGDWEVLCFASDLNEERDTDEATEENELTIVEQGDKQKGSKKDKKRKRGS